MVAIVCQLAETAGAVGKRKKKKEKIPENSKKRAYAVIISALSLFALISRNATKCILFGCHLITTKQTYKVACDDNCIVFFFENPWGFSISQTKHRILIKQNKKWAENESFGQKKLIRVIRLLSLLSLRLTHTHTHTHTEIKGPQLFHLS